MNFESFNEKFNYPLGKIYTFNFWKKRIFFSILVKCGNNEEAVVLSIYFDSQIDIQISFFDLH